MDVSGPKTLFYKKSTFVTHLPVDYFYSPSHSWIGRQPDGTLRVGLTKFAVRMLGEMVDHGFEIELNSPVKPGTILGWIEGFKAVSDLFCTATGTFLGGNAHLKNRIQSVHEKPYDEGWVYAIKGEPDPRCLHVHDYRTLLDRTIDRILEQQKQSEQQH